MNSPPLNTFYPLTMRDHPLFSMENLYRAYRQCRRRKRGTTNALIFEKNLEANLLALHDALNNGRYTPGRSIAFLVTKPKRREIFAADFRDRVVHHLLVAHIEPAWEKRFIHDSYACRKGKGTHKGVERLQQFLRKVTHNNTQPAWYLQLDVKGFFVTINKAVLYERLSAKQPDSVVCWLIRQVLFHEPTKNCLIRGHSIEDFNTLPVHKTLFKTPAGHGLPIGNLTSQFFGNVYLDALDQFVKHQLKAHYYVRYSDDMVLVSQDRQQLQVWRAKIAKFLQAQLQLELNNRQRLQPISDGVDFLGYVIRPDYLLVRRRVVGSLLERLQYSESVLVNAGLKMSPPIGVYPWPQTLLTKLHQWLLAYMAHFKKAQSFRLIASIKQRFCWLDEYFVWQSWRPVLRFGKPRHSKSFRAQIEWFKTLLPDHVLLVQLGQFFKLVPSRDSTSFLGLPERIHFRHIKATILNIVNQGHPVALVGETRYRSGRIAERALSTRYNIIL